MTSTAKRARTMAARYLTAEQLQQIAKQQNRVTARPKTVRKEAPKVQVTMQDKDRDQVMAEKIPTPGQMRRINRAYAAIGLREFTSLETFRAVFPTMLDASLEYRSLKA